MVELFSDNFSTTLTTAISSTSRPITFSVAATSADLAGGTFSIIIFDAGTDANPTHAEILKVNNGSSTSWTASTESGHAATTHAIGSTVRQILTRRSITQQMVDHVDVAGTPDPHTQYLRKGIFTNKGDSLVGLGSGTFTREAVGADGTALIADSTAVTGRRWGIPGLTTVLTHMGDIIVGGILGVAARLGIGTVGQVLTVVQNAPTVTNPTTAPTCSAGSIGGSLVNATSYDFAYEWSSGSPPDAGNTLPSPRTTFVATSTGRVDVQAPAAPVAGLTLYVYIATTSGTLFRAPGTLPNASTSTPNIITISAPVGSGTGVDTANTTGGLSAVWSTQTNVTSVALTSPAEFSVSGSPITGSGTLTFSKANQSSGTFWGGPATGSPVAPTFRSIVPSDLPTMVGSGSSHAPGITPDPGSSAGSTRFLREDASWATPTGGTVMGASGASHAAGLAPDPGSSAGTTRFLREDATWTTTPSGFTNPMTTLWDLIVGGASGAATRLGVGSVGQILSVASGPSIAWSRAVDVMTTIGDLVIGGASGVPTRLAAGTTGQILSMLSSTSIGWSRAVDVMTGIGDLITGGTSGAPTRLAPGTSGTYLQSNGAGSALTWTVPAGSGSTSVNGSPYHEEFTPATSATTVTLANIPLLVLTVFRGGSGQSVSGGDYSVSGNILTFGSAFSGSERVVVSYIGPQILLAPASNLLFETVVTSAQSTISIGTISQAYKDLHIKMYGRGTQAATSSSVRLQINSDSAANYDWSYIESNGSISSEVGTMGDTALTVATIPAANATAAVFSQADIFINNYTGSVGQKSLKSLFGYKTGTATNNVLSDNGSGFWRSTAAITSLSFTLGSGNFDVGSVIRVYGEPVSAGGTSVGTGTRLRISGNQSITTATATAIGWDTEDNDADNQHFSLATNLTGTVSKTAANQTLTGSSTLFTTELSVGQVISVPGTASEKRVVIAIASNTSLTVNTSFVNSASAQTASRVNTAVVFRQPGFYALETGIYSAAISTGAASLAMYLNSLTTATSGTAIGQVDPTPLNASAGYDLSVQRSFQQWDFVEVVWSQSSGGPVNVLADERTHFSVSARPTVIVAVPYVNVQDQKTSGTMGGTFTSGADQTRVLNTIDSDSAGICSLASNQITLPAGTYRTWISCPAVAVGTHQAFLYNVTDSVVIKRGRSSQSSTSDGTVNDSVIATRFTLNGSKVLEIRHRCSSTKVTDGFGEAAGFGTEVYTIAEFWKEG